MKWLVVACLIILAVPSYAAESRIYAQRVQVNGAVLGSPFIVYNSARGPQSEPQVDFYDDRFLVIWNEWNGTDLDVKAARIEMDGTVIDTTPLAIGTGARTQAMPDVATDSAGWMTVWQGWPDDDVFPSLYARRVNYDGTLGTPVLFGNPLGVGCDPKIAWDSVTGKHLVTFIGMGWGYRDLGQYFRWSLLTTTPTVQLIDDRVYSIPTGVDRYSPSMMPGGSWSIVMHAGPKDYWGRSGSTASVFSIEPDGTRNAGGYFTGSANRVGFNDVSQPDLLDHTALYGPLGIYGGVASATDATRVIGVWTRYDVGGAHGLSISDGDLFAARINDYDPDEAMGGTAVSATADVSETYPSLAGDGAGNLLLVYNKETDGSTEIASRILTVNGSGITPEDEVIIRTDTAGSRRSHSAVAYGDDGDGVFLVVWTEGWWGL